MGASVGRGVNVGRGVRVGRGVNVGLGVNNRSSRLGVFVGRGGTGVGGTGVGGGTEVGGMDVGCGVAALLSVGLGATLGWLLAGVWLARGVML